MRVGKRVTKRTLANLSSLPIEQIEAIRRVLKGEKVGPVGDGLECIASRHHGHVDAVRKAMARLGFDKLIDAKASRSRDLVMAMVAARIIAPQASKLGMVGAWANTTLADDLGVADANEDELYEAMDWLIERQGKIEQRLAKRHLKDGSLVLFDLTSSYFEGVTCPLAKLGYSRDRKPGTLQVNYGLLCDARGCPVSVSVFEGNTGDPKTLLPQVEKLKKDFGLTSLVMVGDRGMISNVQIDALRTMDGIDWIAALKNGAIAKLAEGGMLQPDLFDERNLISLTHDDYPGEHLVACRNPPLARLRAAKRQVLIAATTIELDKVKAMVMAGRLEGRDKIGVRVGKVIAKYKVAKHFDRHQGRRIRLCGERRSCCRRSGTGRALRDPHQRRRSRHDGRAGGTQRQAAGRGRACVPFTERCRPARASDPASARGSRQGAHLPVHAGRLRAVAHDPGLGTADIHGRKRRRCRPRAQSRGARQTLEGCARQGAHAHAARRHAGTELHAPLGASGDDRAQHAPAYAAPKSSRPGEATFTMKTRPTP